MFDAIGEGHKIMQKSVSHDEALREAYAADPMQAVIDMHELAREANEIEEKVRFLVAKNVALKKRLAEYSGKLAVLFGVKHDLEKRVRELERQRKLMADGLELYCNYVHREEGDCPFRIECPNSRLCTGEVTDKMWIEFFERKAAKEAAPCP
jgi:hypothetical protein